jgi:pimeloyl-ACP methyl ester carboxylesterase
MKSNPLPKDFKARAILMVAALMLVSVLATTRGAHSSQKESILKPCEIQGVDGKKLCGTYEVFENRATKQGRKIGIKIVVFVATGEHPEPDPYIYIPGGPGSSATEDAPYLAKPFAKIRERRDLLFIDQRGTGGSNPLNCMMFDPADLQGYLGYFFPLEAIRKCRKELESTADLKLYTTTIGMDDFDEIREALGYKQWNLYGASYGTRSSLTYLKRHGAHVRTATLFGVSPTDQLMPRAFPQDTERALQGVLSECVADQACNKAFPDLKNEAKAVLARLLKGPVEVAVNKDAAAGAAKKTVDKVNLRLSRDLVAEAIRYMLYSPSAARRIPLFLHLAAGGDFEPLALAALDYRRNLVGTGSNGMYLTVTCAEDLPWVTAAEAIRLAVDTFLGDYRYRQQHEACELWPRASIESDYREPVRSDVPVLIFTGEWDPVTPPSNGAGVARYLSQSLHVIVPHGGHGFNGLEGTDCVDRIQSEFVARGTTKGLDTSCISAIRRKSWALEKQ